MMLQLQHMALHQHISSAAILVSITLSEPAKDAVVHC